MGAAKREGGAITRAIDWEDLRAFLRMAEAGGLSRAARRLRVSPATVARRVSSLEGDLDVILFSRTSCGYVLTAHGRKLARRLADLPGLIEDACQAARLDAEPPGFGPSPAVLAGGCSGPATTLPACWATPEA